MNFPATGHLEAAAKFAEYGQGILICFVYLLILLSIKRFDDSFLKINSLK
jgi:hypothetical protein